MSKSGFRVPHTLVLLAGMILAAYLLTLVLPQGSFERIVNDEGREQVKAGSYSQLESPARLKPTAMFMAVPEGFASSQEIIFFVFLIGGAFGVLRATGAVDAFIGRLLELFSGKPSLLVAGGVIVFAVGSSTIGMAEEYLPFVPVVLALCLGLGFDAVTAIGIICVGYGVGYGAAIFNPFTVVIAQGVAGVELTSGWAFRLAMTVVLVTVGVHHVLSYARRVRADPSRSLVADVEPDLSLKLQEHPKLTLRHGLILLLTTAAVVLIVYGLSTQLSDWHWYVEQMGAVFLALTILFCLIAKVSPDRAAKEFCKGAAELTTTALLIGFARAIVVVLEQGQVIDTIINGIATPLQATGPYIASVGMFVVQSLCNLFIPSGSGQAYVTMPIMAPLADLVGVSRQISVLAYQMGDGFTNILVPTNAVLVGILAMARIPYDRWVRFIFPFMLKIWVVGSLALVTAVWLGVQ